MREGKAARLAAALLACALALAAPCPARAAGGGEPARYEPGRNHSPITAFAEEFIEECQGGEWLLDETERLLNARQLSIDLLSPDMLDHVTAIGMAGRGVAGRVPKAIGRFKNLEHLLLSGNALTGELPEELFALRELKNVDLSDNLYEGGVPEGFAGLPKLEVLRLSGNRHAGGVPKALAGIGSLRVLDLSGNRLTGGVIPELGGLKNLQFLDLSGNPLGGGIPDEITSLGALEALLLWDAGLSGPIPEGIGRMKSLKYLDLAENSLTGGLPEGLSAPAGLMELTLSDNMLSGTVPDMFGGQPRLTEVHLDGNRLRGHVPDSLKALHDGGTSVTLSRNYMTGPNALAMGAADGAAVAGNFVDGLPSGHYRLTGPSYVRISTGAAVNLLPLLKNVAATGGLALPKPLLPAGDYETEVVPREFSGLVKAEADAGGIWLRALGRLPRASGGAIEVRIRANDGSAWSSCRVGLGTDAPQAGSGGGRGGAAATGAGLSQAALCLPYMKGYEDGGVRPDGKLTREEAAAMLHRISGGPEPPAAPARALFSDVGASRWSAGHIDSVRKRKLMVGYGDGTFRPGEPMTRNEFAAMLCNMAGLEPWDGAAGEDGEAFPLSDVPEDWAAPYVRAAWKAGYVTGYEDMTFRGGGRVTRAEAARMINGALGRRPEEGRGPAARNPYNDIGEGHWGYMEILEASVAHAHPRGAGE
jgi:hypothetical protein